MHNNFNISSFTLTEGSFWLFIFIVDHVLPFLSLGCKNLYLLVKWMKIWIVDWHFIPFYTPRMVKSLLFFYSPTVNSFSMTFVFRNSTRFVSSDAIRDEWWIVNFLYFYSSLFPFLFYLSIYKKCNFYGNLLEITEKKSWKNIENDFSIFYLVMVKVFLCVILYGKPKILSCVWYVV